MRDRDDSFRFGRRDLGLRRFGRRPALVPVLVASSAWVIATLLVVGPALGLSESSEGWTLPRTPWGHPDFDGVWANNTATPLERPEAFGEKDRLSDAELAELQARLAEIREEEQAGDLLGDYLIQKVLEDPEFVGFDQDTGNYNSFWLVERELDHRTSLVVDPPDGRIPAMTPEARRRMGAAFGARGRDNPEDLPRGTRCVSYGVPNVLAGYNSYFRFVQTEDTVVIQQELIHHARIIPIDARPPLPEDLRFWNGDSRGHWDGDTLVVETSHYRQEGAYRGASEDLRVVERFRRISEDVLEWQITFRDDRTWERPWTLMIPLERKDERIYEYACHEGNHSMIGILRGARLEEREAEEGTSSP